MRGMTLNEWPMQDYWSVLLAGLPKGSGKTTFAMSAPKPLVLFSFDLGRVSIPPGVNPNDVLIIPYHDLTRTFQLDGSTLPQRDIWANLTTDLNAVLQALKRQEELILDNGKRFPPPKTIVADGMSRLGSMLVDGRLALNNRGYTDDLPKEDRFKFYGKRLTDVYTMVQQIVASDCNTIMTSWIDEQVITGIDGKPQRTGVWLADIGGKADLLTAGVVSATIVCSSKKVAIPGTTNFKTKFYAQVKSDAKFPWLARRGIYTDESEIDITLPRADGKLPWELIFGA